MNNQNIDIFNTASTKKDALLLIEKFALISNALYTVNVKIESHIDALLTFEEKKNLLEYCQKTQVNLVDPVSFQKMVVSLKEKINQIPTISLTLSYYPTVEVLRNVSDWVISNLKRKYFIEVKVQANLIGGAIVVSNGSFRDYSLKKIIEEKYKTGS